MPVVTLEPTSNTNPDQGGTSAVSSASNTGYGSTSTSANANDIENQPSDNDSAAKSCRWSSFETPPSGVIGLALLFDWTASGAALVDVSTGGSGDADASFDIEYTLNGGSSWTSAVGRSVSASQSGDGSDSDTDSPSGTQSVSIALSASQNVSQVQVRARSDASASAAAPNLIGAEVSSGGNYTTTISSIRLEAEVANTSGILTMM